MRLLALPFLSSPLAPMTFSRSASATIFFPHPLSLSPTRNSRPFHSTLSLLSRKSGAFAREEDVSLTSSEFDRQFILPFF
jgi:hypothetical protein